MSVPFSIIVAVDKNFGMGKNGALPWSLPGEIKHFKEITSAEHGIFPNVVIMGRKTWQSIPAKFRPLPSRINIVLSRDEKTVFPENVLKSSSLDEALTLLEFGPLQNKIGKIFVIGGAELFKIAIACDSCHEICLTKINAVFECDTFFPAIPAAFRCASQSPEHSETGLSYHFETYQK